MDWYVFLTKFTRRLVAGILVVALAIVCIYGGPMINEEYGMVIGFLLFFLIIALFEAIVEGWAASVQNELDKARKEAKERESIETRTGRP